MHPRVVPVIALFGLGLVASAQTPSFRANVSLVTLNVRVLDGRGLFVRDLVPADFSVSEDGVAQTVATFALVDFPIPASASDARLATPPLARGDRVAHAGGRTYVLLVDDLHIAWDHVDRAKEFLRRFVREDFAAGDRATVVFTSDPRPGALTDQPERLVKAIDRFGFSGRWRSLLRPWQHPSLAAVSTVSDWLDSTPGHKALVFVTEDVGCRLIDPNPAPFNAGRIGDEGSCWSDLREATRKALRANATIYTIDPRGLSPIRTGGAESQSGMGSVRQLQRLNANEMARQQPLRALAEDTGGFTLVGSNGFDNAFDRLVRENSTFYVVGYYSTNELKDGTFRKNHVRVNRRDVTVRYRSGYFAPRPTGSG